MALKDKFKLGLGRSDSSQSSSMKDRLINPLKSDKIGKIKSSVENVTKNPAIPYSHELQMMRDIKTYFQIRRAGKKLASEGTKILCKDCGKDITGTKWTAGGYCGECLKKSREEIIQDKVFSKTSQQLSIGKQNNIQSKMPEQRSVKCKDCGKDITGTKWEAGGYCQDCLQKGRPEYTTEQTEKVTAGMGDIFKLPRIGSPVSEEKAKAVAPIILAAATGGAATPALPNLSEKPKALPAPEKLLALPSPDQVSKPKTISTPDKSSSPSPEKTEVKTGKKEEPTKVGEKGPTPEPTRREKLDELEKRLREGEELTRNEMKKLRNLRDQEKLAKEEIEEHKGKGAKLADSIGGYFKGKGKDILNQGKQKIKNRVSASNNKYNPFRNVIGFYQTQYILQEIKKNQNANPKTIQID